MGQELPEARKSYKPCGSIFPAAGPSVNIRRIALTSRTVALLGCVKKRSKKTPQDSRPFERAGESLYEKESRSAEIVMAKRRADRKTPARPIES